MRGVGGAEGEHAHQNHQGGDQQHGHADFAEALDAARHAAVDQEEVEGKGEDEEDEDARGGDIPGGAVRRRAYIVGEEALVVRSVRQLQVAHGGVVGVAEGPALQVHVVHADGERGEQGEHAHIAPAAGAGEALEDARAGVRTQHAAAPADGPLYPAEGDAQQQEGAEVGDHERAAAVLRRQTGEAQEVTQSDGAARYG